MMTNANTNAFAGRLRREARPVDFALEAFVNERRGAQARDKKKRR
jgi:hypothetical protein